MTYQREAGDNTPPQVVWVSPGFAEAASRAVPLVAAVSEPMGPSTLNLGDSFQVSVGGAPVGGRLALSGDGQVATFTPDAPLLPAVQVDLLITTAVADVAGNPMGETFSIHFLTSAEEGPSVVTGEVYDAAGGLPLAGVTARLLSSNGVPAGTDAPAATTGSEGLLTLAVSSGQQVILVSKAGDTSAERQGQANAGFSSVLLDARLMALGSAVSRVNGLLGGSAANSAGDVRLAVTEGAFDDTREIRLTKLSPQGLRSPLPLGWSPVTGVDFGVGDRSLTRPSTLRIRLPAGLSADRPVAAAQWDGEARGWRVIAEAITATGGDAEVPLNRFAPVALAMPDAGLTAPPPAKAGETLSAAAPATHPTGVTGSGSLVPATGMAGAAGTARAGAAPNLPEPVPSGTVFQAQVSESFDLTSGEKVLTQPYVQDLLFYPWPGSGPQVLAAEFPVTPSRDFALGELLLGKVDVNLREPRVSGALLVGSTGGSFTTPEGVTFRLPAGALPQKTSLKVEIIDQPLTLPPDLQGDPVLVKLLAEGLTQVAAVRLDTEGVAFQANADLSVPAPADAKATDNFIVVEDEEIEVGGEVYDADTGTLAEEPRAKARRLKTVDLALLKETDGQRRLTTASYPFPGFAAQTGGVFQFLHVRCSLTVIDGTVMRKVRQIDGTHRTEPVRGARVRLTDFDEARINFAETAAAGHFLLSTTGLTRMGRGVTLVLMVTDPITGITHRAYVDTEVLSEPCAATRSDRNFFPAAVLKAPLVLEAEEKIRPDKTPPTIHVEFSGNTLVGSVIDEGNDSRSTFEPGRVGSAHQMPVALRVITVNRWARPTLRMGGSARKGWRSLPNGVDEAARTRSSKTRSLIPWIAGSRPSFVRKKPVPRIRAAANWIASGVRRLADARSCAALSATGTESSTREGEVPRIDQDVPVPAAEGGVAGAQRLNEDFEESHGGRDGLELTAVQCLERGTNGRDVTRMLFDEVDQRGRVERDDLPFEIV